MRSLVGVLDLLGWPSFPPLVLASVLCLVFTLVQQLDWVLRLGTGRYANIYCCKKSNTLASVPYLDGVYTQTSHLPLTFLLLRYLNSSFVDRGIPPTCRWQTKDLCTWHCAPGKSVWLFTKSVPLKGDFKNFSPMSISQFPVSRLLNPLAVEFSLPLVINIHFVFHVPNLSPVSVIPLSPLAIPPRVLIIFVLHSWCPLSWIPISCRFGGL